MGWGGECQRILWGFGGGIGRYLWGDFGGLSALTGRGRCIEWAALWSVGAIYIETLRKKSFSNGSSQ